MEKWNYEGKLKSNFTKPAKFLEALHTAGIPLDYLMTNAWEDVPEPKVYLLRRTYKRFSQRDIESAIKYFKNNKAN